MTPRMHITNKELREALDYWLQYKFVHYPPAYRVASVIVRKPKTERRFVLVLAPNK